METLLYIHWRTRALKCHFLTSKIIPDLWLVDLFRPLKKSVPCNTLVDRPVYRHHPLVQRLPVLPVGQGDPPAPHRRPADAHPSQEFLPHTPGPGGPPTKVKGGFQPPPHSGGPLFMLAGGFSAREHQLHRRLGGQLQCPRPHHLGLWPSVLLSPLGSAFSVPGHPSPPHHRLPSSGHWHGGEESPTAQGCPQGSHRQHRLAVSPPMGAPGPPGRPKEDSSISSSKLLYGAPLVLPGQLTGVPEPPPVVFKESTRAAPFHIPARGTCASQEPPEVPHQRLFCLCSLWPCQAAEPSRCSYPLTTDYSPWFPALRSSSFWI